MRDDVRAMHERLIGLTQGRGVLSDLRIEFMDTKGLASHRSIELAGGRLVSKEWKSPGGPMELREGSVSDARLLELLEQLIEKQYWTFSGTRFVPDAPTFLFRFYYGDLAYVDFSCQREEIERSPARGLVRGLFLSLVDDTEMKLAAPEP